MPDTDPTRATTGGPVHDPEHGRVGVFSDPDFAPDDADTPVTGRSWSDDEVSGLVAAHARGQELHCPSDDTVLDITPHPDLPGGKLVTFFCPQCRATRTITARG